MTTGSELAWQERKAESFVFTPRTSGYEIMDGRPTGKRRLRRAGHRRTDLFGYTGGPGLGTVVAILLPAKVDSTEGEQTVDAAAAVDPRQHPPAEQGEVVLELPGATDAQSDRVGSRADELDP